MFTSPLQRFPALSVERMKELLWADAETAGRPSLARAVEERASPNSTGSGTEYVVERRREHVGATEL
jgi:hypothetical protein